MTRISFTGLASAIDEVAKVDSVVVRPASIEVLQEVADATEEYVKSIIHVGKKKQQSGLDKHEPGRLNRSVRVDQSLAHPRIVIDAESLKGFHYAETETNRGGSHDFASKALEFATNYANERWPGSVRVVRSM